MKFVYLFVFILISLVTVYYCEPIGITTIVSAFSAMTAFASYGYLKCSYSECCNEPWISYKKSGLKESLEQHLYGQHLVEFTVLRTLNGHLKKKEPKKALVMSFHGATGSGKNFVSHMIAENLYKLGMKSMYVHQYIANKDFPHKERVSEYQDQIREDVIRFTKTCHRSLFIFDEVDKMPPGTLDALKPFLDYHQTVNEIDYRKNIFIFLSNAGSQGIVEVALQFWSQGRDREEISMKDIEPVISRGSFNEIGGFMFSELLRSELIDMYVPFLPLEKKHVRKCIEAVISSRNLVRSKDIINKISDELFYFPQEAELYSISGCKRIEQKVDVELSD